MKAFLDHVVGATLPVLKICLLGSVGAVLARAGILNQEGRRTLSKLVYCLFTPALSFTKLAPVLSGRHLLQWMPLVLNMLFSVAVGLLLGGLLLLLVSPPKALRRHVMVATALGNAGNLPLVLVAALIRETGGRLFEGEVMSEDLAIAYVAMGIWAATVTHFTIGTELLKLPPEQQQQQQEGDMPLEQQQLLLGRMHDSTAAAASEKLKGSSGGAAAAAGSSAGGSDDGGASSCVVELGPVRAPAGAGVVQQQQHHEGQQQQQQEGSQQEGQQPALISPNSSADCLVLAAPVLSNTGSSQGSNGHSHGSKSRLGWQQTAALGWQQQQQQHEQQQHSMPGCLNGGEHERLLGSSWAPDSSSSDAWASGGPSGAGGLKGSTGSNGGSSGSSGSGSGRRSWWRTAGSVAWDCVLQLGSPPMVGIMLAVAVGVTRPVRDQLFEPGGKLLMIQDCIRMFGDCCIPSLLLMLGATLSKGPGAACPPLRVVAGVAAARLVLLPLLGTGWLVLAKVLGWYQAPDKMFILVMLIQNAVPTALNVHTLATLHGNQEAEMAAMLFWQYLLACITLPAALSFFLWLLNTPIMALT